MASDQLLEKKLKYREITARNLKKLVAVVAALSAIDSNGRTIWIANAHRDDFGQRFVVRAMKGSQRLSNLNRRSALAANRIDEQMRFSYNVGY